MRNAAAAAVLVLGGGAAGSAAPGPVASPRLHARSAVTGARAQQQARVLRLRAMQARALAARDTILLAAEREPAKAPIKHAPKKKAVKRSPAPGPNFHWKDGVGWVPTTPTATWVYPWSKICVFESGCNPRTNTGNGYYGGLQFRESTWLGFGGAQYARRADLATIPQQEAIADKVAAGQGICNAWPQTSRRAGVC